jgi:hypothetical protein
MYRLETGNYRHKQFDISRGSYIASWDDSIDGWYVDHKDSDTIDRRGPGFSTLKEAVRHINRGITLESFK